MSEPIRSKIGDEWHAFDAVKKVLPCSRVAKTVIDYFREIPSPVLKISEDRVVEASCRRNPYPLNGRGDYPLCNKEGVLKPLMERCGKKVLDVGGGDGSFALAFHEFEVHTLSASDLRKPNSKVPHYHVGDATYIPDSLFQEWDCIVSASTFYIFPDPAFIIANYYAQLRQGGLLVITDIQLTSLMGQVNAVFNHLNDNGYEVYALIAKNDIGSVETLVMRKTKPYLIFPFTYDWKNPVLETADYPKAAYTIVAQEIPALSQEKREELMDQEEITGSVFRGYGYKMPWEIVLPPPSSFLDLLKSVGLPTEVSQLL